MILYIVVVFVDASPKSEGLRLGLVVVNRCPVPSGRSPADHVVSPLPVVEETKADDKNGVIVYTSLLSGER
jgi:hypothetical protein